MALRMALPFLDRAFTDLMADDGLLVMGAGLGLRVILCRFIMQFLTSKNPVFVINSMGDDQVILDMLEADGLERRQMPQRLNALTNANERKRAYEKGGVIFTSSQTLLIDLLANRLDARLVAGILVQRGHLLQENSKEGFAIRNLKQKNPLCFVKAFTDEPETLTSGFGRVEKTMRALHLNKLFLWPRYQNQVGADLTRHTSHEVVERTCEMTPAMIDIQRAIVDCMDACLRAVKSCTTLDVESLTVDNALFDNFDEIIRRQLGSQEIALRPRARTALADLKSLRKLAFFLLRLDAVTFNTFLDTMRMGAYQDGRLPEWMTSEAGDRLTRAALARLYRVVNLSTPGNPSGLGAKRKSQVVPVPLASHPPSLGAAAMAGGEDVAVIERINMPGAPSSSSTGGGALGYTPTRHVALHPVLEHNPKWQELALILAEIRDAIEFVGRSAAGRAGQVPSLTDPAVSGSAVLIVVRDERNARQISDLLSHGPEKLLGDNFSRYLTKNALRTRAVRDRVRAMYEGLEAEGSALGASGVEDAYTPWYARRDFQSLPADIRDLLLGADAPGHDYTRFAMPTPPVPPPPAGADADAAVGETAAPVPSPPAPALPPVFVSAEQRLLWKSCARALTVSHAEACVHHNSVVAQYFADVAEAKRSAAAAAAVQNESAGAGVAEPRFGDEEGRGIGAAGYGTDGLSSKRRRRGQEQDLLQSPGGTIRLSGPSRAGNAGAGGVIDFVPSGSQDGGGEVGREEGGEEVEILSDEEGMVHVVHEEDGSAPSPSVNPLPRLHVTVFPVPQMDERTSILADLRPNFIIVYDMDAKFIREMEVYTATIAPSPCRLYTLSYASSAEEAKYLRSIEKEHMAFEKLIEEKAHMALSGPRASVVEAAAYTAPNSSLVVKRGGEGGVDAWGMNLKPVGEAHGASSGGIAGALSLLTGGRPGGARAGSAARSCVIMDMRELRSRLPSLLDQAGIDIDPCTLEVGDYVLTPSLCVERKSVPDLVGSLANGRLYNQAEAMGRAYRTPMLLIEFDADKPFALVPEGGGGYTYGEASTGLSSEIDARDVRSRLVLLALHFPGLRILWSRSPHATVTLFRTLKVGMPEPDRGTATRAGGEEEEGAGGHASAGPLNLPAADLLRKLPGVTAGNARSLMARFPSLAALAAARLEDMEAVIGRANAALLHAFLHDKRGAALL